MHVRQQWRRRELTTQHSISRSKTRSGLHGTCWRVRSEQGEVPWEARILRLIFKEVSMIRLFRLLVLLLHRLLAFPSPAEVEAGTGKVLISFPPYLGDGQRHM